MKAELIFLLFHTLTLTFNLINDSSHKIRSPKGINKNNSLLTVLGTDLFPFSTRSLWGYKQDLTLDELGLVPRYTPHTLKKWIQSEMSKCQMRKF